MKKNLLLLAALCFFVLPVSALEWGGLVNDETKYTKTKTNAFNQSNAVFMWLNTPLSSDGAWNLSSEATYKFTFSKAEEKTITNMADVDLLKVNGNIKLDNGNVVIAAGRYLYADLTNVNFAQCSDGIAVNVNLPVVHLGAYAGYTGLLNSLNVSMLISPEDEVKNGKVYVMAHPYLPLMASVEIPSILGNQTVGLQWESILDLGPKKYNRNYANLSISGPITGTIYYSVVSSFGIVNKNIMNYSHLTVQVFPIPEIGISGGVEYASGKQGKLTPYTTVTSKTAYGSAMSPEMSGCIVPSVDFIYTKGDLFVNLNAKLPFDMPEKKTTFKGIGGDLALIYNIFSDLQAEADVSAFKDIATKSADDNLSVTVKAVLSF